MVVKNTSKQVTENQKALALVAHLGVFILNFFAPLIIYLAAEERFVKQHAKASLNWILSYILYTLILYSPIYFLIKTETALGVGYSIIAMLIILILFVFWIVQVIRAVVAVQQKQSFTYRLAIRFVR